jgi:curved DNA-binding protein CbpA
VPRHQTISAAFVKLGLPTDVTSEQVREAFRDLAQVWHPDRFAQDSRVRALAEVKMTELNSAYSMVNDYLAGDREQCARTPEHADYEKSAEHPQRTAVQGANSANPNGEKESPPSSTGRLSSDSFPRSRTSNSRLFLATTNKRKRSRRRRPLWRRILALIFDV